MSLKDPSNSPRNWVVALAGAATAVWAITWAALKLGELLRP